MVDTELQVGDPVRRRAGLIVLWSLGLAAVFGVVTVLSKETPSANLRQPWQDDPYDVPVSLDFVVLPALVTMGVARVQLCRRAEPLPARRLADLMRVARTALAVVLATEITEWTAVALGRYRSSWNANTAWQMGVLALLTVATAVAAVSARTVSRELTATARAAAQPDWLADAAALGMWACRLLPSGRDEAEAAVRFIDRQLFARGREHPIAAALVVSTAMGLPFVAAKIVLEGYPVALLAVVFVFVTSSLFVLVVTAGAYLRVVVPRHDRPQNWLIVTLIACTAAAVAFALHDSLLSKQTVGGLGALYFGTGIATAAVSAMLVGIAGHPVRWRPFRAERRRGRSRRHEL